MLVHTLRKATKVSPILQCLIFCIYVSHRLLNRKYFTSQKYKMPPKKAMMNKNK